MNLAHLRTLVAIEQTGSLSGAAGVVNLSHSAVSVQMKQLEAEIGGALFVTGRRPATLTPLGQELAREASEIVTRAARLKNLGKVDDKKGLVRLGFVPTTLATLLPVVLERLQTSFPELQVSVRSDLSARLAQDIATGALDFAFVSDPLAAEPDVRLTEIGRETLFLIMAESGNRSLDLATILTSQPYIAFNRETWLGAYIHQWTLQNGLKVDPMIELDSIDAIENLVARGFGVSIVPQRLMAPPLEERMRCIALGQPAPQRRVMLASSTHNRRQSVQKALAEIALDAPSVPTNRL